VAVSREGDLIYKFRPRSGRFVPPVPGPGDYTVQIGSAKPVTQPARNG